MWSFAILLWELATREVPFGHLTPMEAGMKVRKRVITYSIIIF
jgi:integrin-linked kinase